MQVYSSMFETPSQRVLAARAAESESIAGPRRRTLSEIRQSHQTQGGSSVKTDEPSFREKSEGLSPQIVPTRSFARARSQFVSHLSTDEQLMLCKQREAEEWRAALKQQIDDKRKREQEEKSKSEVVYQQNLSSEDYRITGGSIRRSARLIDANTVPQTSTTMSLIGAYEAKGASPPPPPSMHQIQSSPQRPPLHSKLLKPTPVRLPAIPLRETIESIVESLSLSTSPVREMNASEDDATHDSSTSVPVSQLAPPSRAQMPKSRKLQKPTNPQNPKSFPRINSPLSTPPIFPESSSQIQPQLLSPSKKLAKILNSVKTAPSSTANNRMRGEKVKLPAEKLRVRSAFGRTIADQHSGKKAIAPAKVANDTGAAKKYIQKDMRESNVTNMKSKSQHYKDTAETTVSAFRHISSPNFSRTENFQTNNSLQMSLIVPNSTDPQPSHATKFGPQRNVRPPWGIDDDVPVRVICPERRSVRFLFILRIYS
ncbi:hypothetical protein HDU83_009733 [Entophlyctis luteolus]|nr:hypothetical protein HDU83_009733 [Entophlyctis luteolus]